MKKFLVCLVLFCLVFVGIFIFKDNDTKESKNIKIKVAEVTHSVFYAPQYVADALGYFENEGLDIDFVLTPGVNKKKWKISLFNMFLSVKLIE